MARLSMSALWADAVFVSGLQRRDELGAAQVRQAAGAAIRAFGCSGCAGRVAQEFGDHPETAVIRMRWARGVAREAFADPPPETFSLLAEVVDDPLLTGGAGYMRELMLAVGRATDGMIVSSRRRLLAHLRAGDGAGAALEMEKHLRVLLYMRRLALPSSKAIAIEAGRHDHDDQ